ncbi:MAG: hypothetical protein ACE5R6_19470 [Candidatus Heimdallarchaeota archaeon]
MGRSGGFVLGLLGIILPGYIDYISNGAMELACQGLFYKLLYGSAIETKFELISGDWITQAYWPANTVFYLYLASLALAILGIIVILGSERTGGILLLLAGIVSLGWLGISYTNNILSGYPIPVGSILLILAGLIGMRD